jgi:hypothetical protein
VKLTDERHEVPSPLTLQSHSVFISRCSLTPRCAPGNPWWRKSTHSCNITIHIRTCHTLLSLDSPLSKYSKNLRRPPPQPPGPIHSPANYFSFFLHCTTLFYGGLAFVLTWRRIVLSRLYHFLHAQLSLYIKATGSEKLCLQCHCDNVSFATFSLLHVVLAMENKRREGESGGFFLFVRVRLSLCPLVWRVVVRVPGLREGKGEGRVRSVQVRKL